MQKPMVSGGIEAGGSAPQGGANRPEGSHIRSPRAPGDRDFAGICPFDGDCLEGMASGPALQARWGGRGETLPADHPGWAIAADHITGLCTTLTYIVRPDRIILGGDMRLHGAMLAHVRAALTTKPAGYDPSLRGFDMTRYIAPSDVGASISIPTSIERASHG